MPDFQIINGDALQSLRAMPDGSVDCIVTSPPYWGLRDYGHEGQMGIEETSEDYTRAMVEVFREARRVLKAEGTFWLNLGDSTIKKNLVGIPWRMALALQADGWMLRSDIIWHKSNPMPESVADRPTKAHEYLFLLSKSERYFYDADAVKEPAIYLESRNGRIGKYQTKAMGMGGDGTSPTATATRDMTTRNRRSVWTIATEPFKDAHFAAMPRALVAPCILAGCPEGGTILDPFAGSGTVGTVALNHNRKFIGIELNPAYADMARRRISASVPGPNLFNQTSA